MAAGAAAFGHGWSSVHGMRTDQACRGRGLAGRVLAGLADAAMHRGMERSFLQVEDGNASALALYGGRASKRPGAMNIGAGLDGLKPGSKAGSHCFGGRLNWPVAIFLIAASARG